MRPYYEDEAVTLYHGDNREVLRELPSASVDACVTDPPYELAFMGRKWDASGIAYDKWLWAEVWRVLKPGGYLLAFGGTRTWHRLAVAIEDAGFDIRDSIAWMYGSGFPKSLDVSKAIDKQRYDRADIYKVTAWIKAARDAAGVTNKDIDDAFGFAGMAGHWTSGKSQPAVPTLEQVPTLLEVLGVVVEDVPDDIWKLLWELNSRKGQPGENWAKRKIVGTKKSSLGGTVAAGERDPEFIAKHKGMDFNVTAPATDSARTWNGWGTALKPAFEPIVVARKPLQGTVAENVLRWGTGALNIDGSRISTEETLGRAKGGWGNAAVGANNYGNFNSIGVTVEGGRWPANVILDESQAAELDRQSGVTVSGQPSATANYGSREYAANNNVYGAGLATTTPNVPPYGDMGGASRFFYVPKANSHERPQGDDGTAHPTVKPVDLMRYLVKLVTPPGGTVLEPFAGSGSTLEACIVEGFKCVGIELTDEYLPLIVKRVTKPIEPVMF